MIDLAYDTSTDQVRLVRAVTIKAGSPGVPVRLTFSSAPTQAVSDIQIALGTEGASPTVLAFNEEFTAESSTVWTAILDANDTRLTNYMNGRKQADTNAELVLFLDGERQAYQNITVTVQPPIVVGPETTEGGPVYLTQANADGIYLKIIGPIASSSSTSNHILTVSNGVDNALELRNLDNTHYSAVRCTDLNGVEKCAWGYGNPGAATPVFRDCTYWEGFAGTVNMRVVINYATGVTAEFNKDTEDFVYYQAGTLGSQNNAFRIRRDGSGIQIGDVAGSTGAEITGCDANHAIVFRESGIDSINHYEYGGTLASGKGHVFKTGGLRGSQSERLRIANDGVKASVPVEYPSYTVSGVPSASRAGQQIYVSNESGGAVMAFSDGTNWRRVTDRAVIS